MDCTVCARPDLADVHRMVDGGGGVNAAAKAFGVPKTTLKRHLANHRKGQRPPTPPATDPTPAPTVLVQAPTRCAVCRSPYRDEINQAILDGTDSATISRLHADGPSHDSIHRHRAKCVPEMVQEARVAGLAQWAGEAKPKIRALVRRAERLVELATEEDDAGEMKASFKDAAAAMNAAKGVLELLAKITGELGPDVEVKILATPQWRAVQEALIGAVERISDPMVRAIAAREIGRALREVEGGGGAGSTAMLVEAG